MALFSIAREPVRCPTRDLLHSYTGILLACQPFHCWYYSHILLVLSVSDFVQCLGLVIVGRALAKDAVHSGPSCTLQGFLLNCGDIGSAIWSFVIAMHTFFLLAGGRKWRTWVAERSTSGKSRWFLCIGIWLFILFIGIIGPVVIEPLHPEKGPFCTLFRRR